MKKLLLLTGLLVAGINANAHTACITNITISCENNANVLINGSSSYNIVQTYTNASALDLMADSCDSGTVLTFGLNDCPVSDTVVATVSWICDDHEFCGGGHCGGGNHFKIVIPAGCNYYSVRIYSLYGCCTITKCVLFASLCDPH